MRKVILSVLVTLTLVAFTFSGCKKSQPEPTTPPEKKAAGAATEKPAVPPVEKPAEK
jgi:hypothetical protein